ncbi:hypothetical protein [Nocardioides aurantiacus]|uniref:hypothetical protein n=1 Tax=Nocardioides aurantiacus TaxID=86796 RepID=UPI00403F3708
MVATVVALTLLGAATAQADFPIKVPEGSSAQPASLVYDGDAGSAEAYARPGGLVVAGRDNYDSAAFRQVSAAGGSVLLYLDPVIDNAYGRYHALLLHESHCGPATSPWPGLPRANNWGNLSDFRPGSVLQQKLRCVLETMVAENPHMAGWFADDVGSRSWFPGHAWNSWDSATQAAYRAGAIEITRTFREVADQHGLIFIVNGTWGAGPVKSAGGGYPDAGVHGNALADGGFVEHHDGRSNYFSPYACSDQWAAQSPVTRGAAVNFAVTETWEGVQEYVDSGCFAYVNRQQRYHAAAPWGVAKDLGLPSGVRP